MKNIQALWMRIEQLEIESAFQQDLIAKLDNTTTELQLELLKLRTQLQLLVEKTKGYQPSLVASLQQEIPPPHY